MLQMIWEALADHSFHFAKDLRCYVNCLADHSSSINDLFISKQTIAHKISTGKATFDSICMKPPTVFWTTVAPGQAPLP